MMRFIFLCFLFHSFAYADLQTLNSRFEKLSPEDKALYKDLGEELRCPTCTGLSVLQSDIPFSLEIRKSLLDQIQEGRESDAIMKFFKDRFGLWILRTPPTEGFHWLAWFVPLLFAFFGALFLWFVFWRRRRHTGDSRVRSVEDIVEEFKARIEEKRRGL